VRVRFTRRMRLAAVFLLSAVPALAQQKRLWVLRAPGEMVEYDPATFAIKERVKVPPEAMNSQSALSVNRFGQILFAPSVSLPLSEDDVAGRKFWLWDGHAASSFDQGISRKVVETGSNQAVTEIAPAPYLAADGKHLFWFSNEQRRLEREDVDLSTTTMWSAWQTDLSGGGREELASTKLPDCRCTSGSCEETCPVILVGAQDAGVDQFFLATQFVAGQTTPAYKATTIYKQEGGKWTGSALPDPLHRLLDASSDGAMIVEAIPDTGCCGWSNQSNDQTIVHASGKILTVFDEQATYKNPDYDVSFYTADARLSPELTHIAMSITATAQPNKPIQESQQGQANPEESQRIRKALAELPALSIETLEDAPQQVISLPHASLVGWISEKELLIVENHFLVIYNMATKTRRKSAVRVEDSERVFLR
jgi:hypothetical protein